MHCATYDILFPGRKQKCSLEVDLDVRSCVGYTGNPVWYILDVLYTTNRDANIHEEYFTIWH
jgi:hypothetical protein